MFRSKYPHRQYATTSNSNSREFNTLFWLPWVAACMCTYPQYYICVHLLKNKNNYYRENSEKNMAFKIIILQLAYEVRGFILILFLLLHRVRQGFTKIVSNCLCIWGWSFCLHLPRAEIAGIVTMPSFTVTFHTYTSNCVCIPHMTLSLLIFFLPNTPSFCFPVKYSSLSSIEEHGFLIILYFASRKV